MLPLVLVLSIAFGATQLGATCSLTVPDTVDTASAQQTPPEK